MNSPEISVLIASRNRSDAIGRFLTDMESVVGHVSCEIIVADNSTADHTSELLRKHAHRLPLRVLYVPEKGKSRSLNRAISQARGDLLVFADDDIHPDHNWLYAYRQAAEQRPDINVFGGRILVDRQQVPEWIRQSYNLQTILLTEQDLGDQARLFGFDEYPIGPNIAVRKKLLQLVNSPWPEQVGPGTDLPVGDEVLFLRAISPPASTDRLYVPASIVYHEFNQSNLLFVNALRRCYSGGYAAGKHSYHLRSENTARRADIVGLLHDRIKTCKSFRELICMVSRATGYYIGTSRIEPHAIGPGKSD